MKEKCEKRPELRASELFFLPFLTEDAFYALLEQQVRVRMGLTDHLEMASLLHAPFGKCCAEGYEWLQATTGINMQEAHQADASLREELMQADADKCEQVRLWQGQGKQILLHNDLPLPKAAIQRLCQKNGLLAMEIVPQRPEKTARSLTWAQKRFLKRVYGRHGSFISAYEGERFAGLQAIMAMQLRHVQDDGYTALGAYWFSQAMWLAWQVQRHGYDTLIFLARDGYWVKEAFDCLNAVFQLPVRTEYLRVSRQAVLPLYFERPEDALSLPVLVNMKAHTPRTLLSLLQAVLPDNALHMAQEAQFQLDAPLDDVEGTRLIGFFRDKLFDEKRFAAYRQCAREYWQPFFVGKCATFDVGYNLRSEYIMQRVTGADVTAYVTHVDSDLPYRRALPFETLYATSPYVSWVVREQFLLEDAPGCVWYRPDGIQEGEKPQTPEKIRQMQQSAMRFVRDMRDTFGAHLLQLYFRPQDGCVAFERLLHSGHMHLKATLENDFHGVEEDTAVQWRLMQTDYQKAYHRRPKAWWKMKRVALIALGDKKTLRRKLFMKRK